MDNDVRNRIATNIIFHRKKLRMSVKDLSQASGIAENTIRVIEQQKVSAQADTLELLATGLRIDVSNLFKKRK